MAESRPSRPSPPRPALEPIIRRFARADRDTRLEALIDYARRLPELPAELRGAGDREAHRVHECQTPVFLWLGVENGTLRMAADVPRESPTVRGFVSLLVHALDGAPAEVLREVPEDLLHQLGLEDALGMMRTQGLTAIVRRVKAAA